MKPRLLSTLCGALALVAMIAPAALAQGNGPVTQPDYASLDEDTVAVVYPLLNDTDPQGAGLALDSVSSTPRGSVRIDGLAVVFTPNPNWNGELELTYVVRSAGGESTGQIFIVVQAVNDAPVAENDSAVARAGEMTTIDVLANDTDVDGDELVLGTVNRPVHGSVAVVDNAIEYIADGEFSGTDSFTYTIFDPAGASAEAIVEVAVEGLPATTTIPPVTTLPPATSAAPSTTVVPTTTIATSLPPATTAAPPTTAAPATTAPPIALATGPTLVPNPEWVAPAGVLAAPVGTVNPDGFFASLGDNLRLLALPLLLLALFGLVAWLMSARGRSPGRRYAVVLVDRDDSLPIYDKPDAASRVVHRYEYSARQIDVVGRKRTADGLAWFSVSTASGRGWARADFLTEDVARVTFETDVVAGDLVREMRRKLKQGSTLGCSARGAIDPETFSRDSSRRQLGGHATAKLAALMGDWRASFHIDSSASLAALRPPELRNLHWISFEAPGLDPWQLFFEYHEGRPYPVAALAENVSVPV